MTKRLYNWMNRHELAAYTLFYIVAAEIVFWFVPVYRLSLINTADGFNQYYPVYVYLGRYFRDLVPSLIEYHTVPMFDFSIGYGNDVLTTLNYYGLGNVFYLLAALAPAKYASIVYTFASLLQLYLAGLAFIVNLDSTEASPVFKSAGALIYVFSGWSLRWGVTFPTFLITLITLPFVMRGVRDILRGERFRISGRYVASMFLLACCGFYFVYMDVIAIAVYGLTALVFHFRGRIGAWLRAVVSLIVQTAVSIGMAGVIILPVILAYLQSDRAAGGTNWRTLFSLYSTDTLVQKAAQIYNGDNGWGLSVPLAILLVVFFLRYRKAHPVLAGQVFICTVGIFLPAVEFLMDGFTSSGDRWAYILFYYLAEAAVVSLSEWMADEQNDARSARYASGVVAALYLVWAAATICNVEDRTSAVIRIGIIGVTLLVVLLRQRHWREELAGYCLVGTMLVAFLNTAPASMGGNDFYASFRNFYAWHEIESSQLASAETESGFYRTDIYDSSLGSSLVLNRNGASSYYSLYNSNVYTFLAERLVSTGTEGSSYTLRGLDGRKSLEMFLSVTSYALDRSADTIVSNDLCLPLGYTYTSYLLDNDAETLDPLDRNQNLLRVVELEEAPDSESLQLAGEIPSEWETLPSSEDLCNIETLDANIYAADTTSEIHVQLPDALEIDDQSEYYLLFHGLEYLGDEVERYLIVDGKLMRVRPMGSYYLQQDEYMVKIDLTDEDLQRGYITIGFRKEMTYRLENLELRRLDISQYEAYYDALTEVVLEDTEFLPNRITGQITADQDRILLMTIPYSTGWTCRIDGVETKVLRADQGFCAVVVGEGSHAVEWSYCTPGLTVGFCITIISVLAMVILVRTTRKRI